MHLDDSIASATAYQLPMWMFASAIGALANANINGNKDSDNVNVVCLVRTSFTDENTTVEEYFKRAREHDSQRRLTSLSE